MSGSPNRGLRDSRKSVAILHPDANAILRGLARHDGAAGANSVLARDGGRSGREGMFVLDHGEESGSRPKDQRTQEKIASA
jgi:hypothetical protein